MFTMKRVLKRAFNGLLDSRAGRQAVGYAAVRRPDVLLDAVGYQVGHTRFTDNLGWPETVSRFEDVAPIVLSSNAANRGVSAMSWSRLHTCGVSPPRLALRH